MMNTLLRRNGDRRGFSHWRETTTVAGSATQATGLRSIIDPMDMRSARNPSTISPLSVSNVTRLQPRSSAGGDTTAEASSLPTLNSGKSPETPPSTGYRSLSLRIVGVAPLVMHSGQLANPLSPQAKELRKISKKRAKTDADHEFLSRVEWNGGLWLSGGVPCIPGESIEACFVQAARKSKRGVIARAGMISPQNWPLEYDGPHDLNKLWEDESFRLIAGVRVGQARVMRTRPIFRKWAARVTFEYLDDQMDESDILDILRVAGRIVGLGDWRPRYGRFEIES